MAQGYTENVTVDEGYDEKGIRTQMHFEGDDIVVQKTFDAAPHLKYAEQARLDTAGKSWGEGRLVGHIPDLYYAPICAIKDRAERERAVRDFFRQNPAFLMFDRFLK